MISGINIEAVEGPAKAPTTFKSLSGYSPSGKWEEI